MDWIQVKKELQDAALKGVHEYLSTTRGARLHATATEFGADDSSLITCTVDGEPREFDIFLTETIESWKRNS